MTNGKKSFKQLNLVANQNVVDVHSIDKLGYWQKNLSARHRKKTSFKMMRSRMHNGTEFISNSMFYYFP
jgi:hypothetical protein